MTEAYKLQGEILKLFQGKADLRLSESEQNKLNIYKSLVIDSMYTLLAKIFSEIYEFHKEKWQEITKDYLELRPSKSPVYSKLCEEFPDFISSDHFVEKYGSNNYFADLAKFKWLDLSVYNAKEKPALSNGFIQDYVIMDSQFNIPLIINFLKNDKEINKEDDMEEIPCKLFIYRNDCDSKVLVLNQITSEFISLLEENNDIESIKKTFVERYFEQSSDLEAQVDELIDYLKKMKILLI